MVYKCYHIFELELLGNPLRVCLQVAVDGESFTSSPYLVLFIYEDLLSTILHISLSGSLICIFMGYNLPGFITSGTT